MKHPIPKIIQQIEREGMKGYKTFHVDGKYVIGYKIADRQRGEGKTFIEANKHETSNNAEM